MNTNDFDINDDLDENGRPRRLTAEEQAALDALPPAKRKAFMEKLREAAANATREYQCVYGPPSAFQSNMVQPPNPRVQLVYGPPNMLGGFAGLGAALKAAAENAQHPQSCTWKCECGAENAGRFCTNCGKPRK